MNRGLRLEWIIVGLLLVLGISACAPGIKLFQAPTPGPDPWTYPEYTEILEPSGPFVGSAVEAVLIISKKETVDSAGFEETVLTVTFGTYEMYAIYSGEMPDFTKGDEIRVRGAYIPTMMGDVFWIASWQPLRSFDSGEG